MTTAAGTGVSVGVGMGEGMVVEVGVTGFRSKPQAVRPRARRRMERRKRFSNEEFIGQHYTN
jgi:hypothetical protein